MSETDRGLLAAEAERAASAPMRAPTRASRWKQALGLDFHVIVTLLFRGWTVIAGASMLILLPLWLSPVQLGYHYTFASILALQIFFELGMNQVVTQITSHELAHLEQLPDGALAGSAERLDRLTGLARLLRRWYSIAASLFAIVVGAVGLAFFSRNASSGTITWAGPWLLICASTAGNLYLSPTLAMIEGAGRVGEVARLRLFQSIGGYACTAAALACGAGLWASALMSSCALVGSALWLRRHGRMIDWLRRRAPATGAQVDWRREILPFQWRIALSWISGYFIFQLFTPMLFENQGAVEAGRFGMVLAICNAIQSIGMSWIYSRSPQMAASISRGEGRELQRIFLGALKPSIAFTALACVFLVLGVWGLNAAHVQLVHRLSSLPVIACLAMATVTNSLIFAFAVFMRSHKEEPMMMPSIVLAVTALAIAHWASRSSVELTAELYLAATALTSLPWSFFIFRRYWNRY